MAANRVRSKGIDKVRRTMPTRPSVIAFSRGSYSVNIV